MANNRLYIKCKYCGESLLIDKSFGGAYHINEEKLALINRFFENHAFCGDPNSLADGGWFELHDECHDL